MKHGCIFIGQLVALAWLCSLAACSTYNCPSGYTGESCDRCMYGYHKENGFCNVDRKCELNHCNANGTCRDETGIPICQCYVGYDGENCENCARDYVDYGGGVCKPEDPCSDETECAEENRKCHNNQGYVDCGDCLAGYYTKRDTDSCIEPINVVSPDAQEHNVFGWSVATDGDLAIIGAPGDDEALGGSIDFVDSPGAAYIFRFRNGQWIEEAKLMASDARKYDEFGWSVAISEKKGLAIVGAPAYFTDWSNGAAYVFQLENGDWTERTKLEGADSYHANGFGTSVALDGETAIVGSPGEDAEGVINPYYRAGAAYIYKLENGQWSEKAKLSGADPYIGYAFGESVSLDGDVAIVGAPGEDGEDDYDRYAGAAYIFRLVNGTWANEKRLIASDRQEDDYFGESVSISGDAAIVGSPAFFATGKRGAAYIFQLVNSEWQEIQILTASGTQLRDDFGSSVSISEDEAIVGAYGEKVGGADAGAAYIFRLENSDWIEKQRLMSTDAKASDVFGYSVSINEGRAIVGVPQDDGGEDDSIESTGSVFIY